MPPSGLRSRNFAIGDSAPSGSSSSIFVFGSVMNTVYTPCSCCGTFSDTCAPSVLRYTSDALAMSRTAMATWLRRPIIVDPFVISLYREHMNVAHRLFAPGLRDDAAHGATYGIGNAIRIAAARSRQGLERLNSGIECEVRQQFPIAPSFRNADQINL